MLAASSGLVGREDLSVRAHEAANKLSVFVVDEGNLLAAEKTRLLDIRIISCWNWHSIWG
jgi:hypothetical protein